jgi:hypothetical protein
MSTGKNPNSFHFHPWAAQHTGRGSHLLPRSTLAQDRWRPALLPRGRRPAGGGERRRPGPKPWQPPRFLLLPPFLHEKKLESASNREEWHPWWPVEEGGAAAGPLAGARVHPMGERAAVERPGGCAHSTGP